MKKRFHLLRAALHVWPMPKGRRGRAACPFCDTLHEGPRVHAGEAAHCIRCGHVIYENRPGSLPRATAFSLAALALLITAQFLPFLTLQAAGIQRELTLINSATALMDEGSPILGSSILIFTLIVPLFLCLSMLYCTLPLLMGRSAPLASHAVKWLYRSEPWNMVEVFLLGVIVSLLKLSQVADVSIKAGFWCFAGVMLCLAATLAGIDRHELWDRLEIASGKSELPKPELPQS